MPFNVGPFEVMVFALIIVGVIVLLARGGRSPAPAASLRGVDGSPAEPESLDALIAVGWRIESESSDYTFLVRGQRVNHVLHFLIGLFTLGVWWIVWLILASRGGEERRTVKKT